MSIGVAIVGAGIFARDEHLPAVQACPLLSLKAVYSCTEKSAQRLARCSSKAVDLYFDETPNSQGCSLDDLFDREDIDAVLIALPIPVQPDIIHRAIQAGKHVLSEKPVAKDVETAEKLIRWYKSTKREELWCVGENFRFLDSLRFGVEQLGRLGGDVVSFSVKLHGFIDEHDKYYKTAWRQEPQYQGGFLLDGGIHFVAGLRALLNAAGGQDITQASAFTSLLQPTLAPLDTLHATAKLRNGRFGSFHLCYGAEFKSGFEIQVVTTTGAVTVTPTQVVLFAREATTGEKSERVAPFKKNSGVKQEVAAFANSIVTGKVDLRGSPEEALKDLRVLQAMLVSGEEEGAVKKL